MAPPPAHTRLHRHQPLTPLAPVAPRKWLPPSPPPTGLQPTVFYGWQKKLFEEGAVVFEQPRAKSGRQEAAEQRRIAFLEAKLRNKDEVMPPYAESARPRHTPRRVIGANSGQVRAPGYDATMRPAKVVGSG